MAIYFKEWPVLVLCPSGARYHWEEEFRKWLGKYSELNKRKRKATDKMFPDSRLSDDDDDGPLLHDRQINVLTSSKSEILPHEDTKVVICSYGLSSALIENGKIFPRLFKCAIVDESHMLKNKASKRTSSLVPVLSATHRCVLLSGTPALARPLELWPQLAILGTAQHGWGNDEQDFIDKYVKHGNARRSAELHTMLRGTVMIRRLKNDILKTLPRKRRSKANVDVMACPEQRSKFLSMMSILQQGKGVLGKLARIHQKELDRKAAENDDDDSDPDFDELLDKKQGYPFSNVKPEKSLGLHGILQSSTNSGPGVADRKPTQLKSDYSGAIGPYAGTVNDPDNRVAILAKLYGLTGEAKIPLIVDMLDRWLTDPTKGKICIFAHHLSVLNAIENGAGLSNDRDSRRKFIRIDGSTLPKQRQEQISAFQNDPSIRVAVLGITAAGVAVTLTASSTVWFAELFWTPAIMIQAEGKSFICRIFQVAAQFLTFESGFLFADRCHRIGQ